MISYTIRVAIVQVNNRDNFRHNTSFVVFLRFLIILEAGNPGFGVGNNPSGHQWNQHPKVFTDLGYLNGDRAGFKVQYLARSLHSLIRQPGWLL